MLWGPNLSKKNSNCLFKTQKKFIRIVKNVGYTAHTNELFKELGILKISDLIELELNKFVYMSMRNKLPGPLTNIFQTNNEVHT